MSRKRSWKKLLFLAVIAFVLFRICFAQAVLKSEASAKDKDADVYYRNQETGYVAIVEDDAELFTKESIWTFLEEMKALTEYGNVCVKTISQNTYYSSTDYANAYYDERFGETADGTVFLIDMDFRELVLTSEGRIKRDVTSALADSIMDNVYSYASEGRYDICCQEALEQVHRLLEGKKIAQPMKYICNAFLAIILSIVLNYGFVRHYSKKKKVKHPEFMLHTEEKIKVQGWKVVEKRHIAPTASSGSSGGSYRSSSHSSSYHSSGHSGSSHSSSHHSSSHSSHHSSGSHRF